jgi:hypothetical protein
MKRTMLKKGILLIGAVLFAVSFASASVASEDIAATKTIKGSIVAIHADTGMVDVKDDAGQTLSLKAGSEVNLDTFSQGEQVTIQCGGEEGIGSWAACALFIGNGGQVPSPPRVAGLHGPANAWHPRARSLSSISHFALFSLF